MYFDMILPDDLNVAGYALLLYAHFGAITGLRPSDSDIISAALTIGSAIQEKYGDLITEIEKTRIPGQQNQRTVRHRLQQGDKQPERTKITLKWNKDK